jgi:4'-phosphopantetheinyl transferase
MTNARRQVTIANRDLHVWTVRLHSPESCFENCSAWLSAEESARAARFHFERHRRAFVFGRAALRALLGNLLGLSPERVQFRYGSKGKPDLADSTSALRFNASNSGDLAVYAFALGTEIGIDVEQLRPITEVQDIAKRFFATEEVAELMSLPPSEQVGGFFRCWTRKEAYIKAIGDGLSVPLDSFRVTLRPGDPARMLHLGGSEEAARNWTMHDFAPAPDYFGAVAYPDLPRPVEFHPLLTVQELLQSL